jgi:pimeloyl-ACP methyl ester carboxylesterase
MRHMAPFLAILAFFMAAQVFAQQAYKLPPKEVVDILDAPPTPLVSESPTGNLLAPIEYEPTPAIARSGAYNRTPTPFGFQSERRTLWGAPDTDINLSPFMHADNIKTPLLLIHGEADDNSGTFPLQIGKAVRGAPGFRGRLPPGHTPYREPRLRGPEIGPSYPRRDVRLVRDTREEPEIAPRHFHNCCE